MIFSPSTIDGVNGKPDFQFDINKTKKLLKKSFSLHYNNINSCLFVNGKQTMNFKQRFSEDSLTFGAARVYFDNTKPN